MERAIWIPKILHHAKRPLSDRNSIIPLYHLLTERQKDRMLFQIIYDLKRSVDLRLLLITGALFILDDLFFNVIFIAKTFPKFTTSENYLSTNWIFKGNASSRLFSKQLGAEFAVTRRKCRFGNTTQDKKRDWSFSFSLLHRLLGGLGSTTRVKPPPFRKSL